MCKGNGQLATLTEQGMAVPKAFDGSLWSEISSRCQTGLSFSSLVRVATDRVPRMTMLAAPSQSRSAGQETVSRFRPEVSGQTSTKLCWKRGSRPRLYPILKRIRGSLARTERAHKREHLLLNRLVFDGNERPGKRETVL